MENKYVSYGTAKLLKINGFNEKCFFSYLNDWGNKTVKLEAPMHVSILNPEDGLRNDALTVYNGVHWEYVSAPTISDAIDWLREKYQLHIYAFYTTSVEGSKWCYEIQKIDEDWTYSKHYGMEYNECLEEAINYSLNYFVKEIKAKKRGEKLVEITPELLQANGFNKKYDDILMQDYYVTKDGRVTIVQCDDSIVKLDVKLWSCHVDDSDMDTIGRTYIRFMSQLQSFLDSCEYNINLDY